MPIFYRKGAFGVDQNSKGRPYSPFNAYLDKLAAMPPEEAELAEKRRRARMSAGLKKRLAIKRILNQLLRSEINPTIYERDVLEHFGYEIDECGLPTVAIMVLFSMASRAMRGDAKAAAFVFSYAGIPNMDQVIKREELDYLRHRGEPKVDVDKLEAVKILLDIPSAIN